MAARSRFEVKDSNQGSQSTRGEIGLVHRRLVRVVAFYRETFSTMGRHFGGGHAET